MKDFKFSAETLDEDIMKQPALYAYYAEKAVEAEHKRDLAEIRLREVGAERALAIRKKLAKKGEKVTEGLINNKLVTDKEYRKAQKEYLEAKAKADKAKVVKEAFKQRRDMIDALVRLFMIQSGSEIRSRIAKGVETEAIRKEVRKKIRKRKKK